MKLTDAALWLPRRLEQGMDRAFEWEQRRERVLVLDGHDALRGLWWRSMGRYFLAAALLIVYDDLAEPWHTLTFVGLIVVVLLTLLPSNNRAMAYRRGWLDGRQRMANNLVASSVEIDNAGGRVALDAQDWWDAEYNHDNVHVLGLPPTPPPAGGPGEGR